MFLVIALLIWVGAMGIWWLCSNAFRNADIDRFKNRLLGSPKAKKGKPQQGPALIHADQAGFLVKVMQRLQLQSRVQQLLEQAGLKWTVAKLLNLCILLFGASFLAGWTMLPPPLRRFSFVGGIIGACLPVLLVTRKRKKRLRRFEELFPESLEFVARSMRAGHAFSVSLEMIHREFEEPLAGEFRRAFDEHNLGLPLGLALQ